MENSPDSWKHFLRGAFAFQDAPFASHPKDEERARTMLEMALAENVTPEEILNEARAYLQHAQGWGSHSIEVQLERIRSFIKTPR